jgi:hypothetical protein
LPTKCDSLLFLFLGMILFNLASANFVSKTGSEIKAAKTKIPTTNTESIFAVPKLFLFVSILFSMINEQ